MNWWERYIESMRAQALQITNPLGKNSQGEDVGFLDLFRLILDGLILLATPIVIVMVIYAGFLFVTAQGNVTKLETAKRAIAYALIGALILLGASAISALIQGSIESLRI
ncbi:MAG: hypothetical protein WDZ74_02305 [Candidatus Paceibacterota bacterium]